MGPLQKGAAWASPARAADLTPPPETLKVFMTPLAPGQRGAWSQGHALPDALSLPRACHRDGRDILLNSALVFLNILFSSRLSTYVRSLTTENEGKKELWHFDFR